ncbi:hypothetical protein PAXRUDRAFT_175682 [Paxillus rubicundulus Ve08.2h10]|uniref:Uncharacterized protein n=1 Tax=Paxillus rubicundulus Ve08.2h10 TaxID=930991 RepID=A0A0D0D3G5_9AGAM|nr:hypothetical protein PAXRUDRAFT_175682 [Paxillus rubicundulus Ve08.2h10]
MVKKHVAVYRAYQRAMISLSDEDTLVQYQVLEKEHLKVSTTVSDPNARGHLTKLYNRADSTLAWFWTMDVQRDAEVNNWMTKCMFISICCPSWKELKLSCTSVYRGHWLRAKALKDRWEEEVELLRAEGK